MSTPAFTPDTLALSALPSLPLTARKDLPNCPAVYFVLDTDDEVVYIGQTTSLAQRWLAHHAWRHWADDPSVYRIAWLVMTDATLLRQVERLCVDFWKPKYNHPYGRPSAIPKKFFSIGLPEDVFEKVSAEAMRSERSISAQIRFIVIEWARKTQKAAT